MAALGLAAVGSALGCGTAGKAAIGAWKKAYLKGKNALFTLLIFVGAPIAQTIYGMLLMMYIMGKADANPTNWAAYLGVGETVALFVMVFSMMLVS